MGSLKRKLAFCQLMTATVFFCSAQTPKLDSLKRLIHAEKQGRAQLKHILEVCDMSEMLPKDTLWSYALRARQLAVKLKDRQSYSLAVIGLSEAYINWENLDSARALLQPELAKYTANDPATRSTYFKLARANIDLIGEAFDYKVALARCYSLLGEAEKYQDSLVMAENMNTLGAFNYDLDRLPESAPWFYRALTITRNQPKYFRIRASVYLNLSENYWWTDRPDSAIYFIRKALALSLAQDNPFYISLCYQKLANNYVKKKAYQTALGYILQSLKIGKLIYGDEPQQEKLISLAYVYQSLKQYDKAISTLTEGIRQDSIFRHHSPHSGKKLTSGDLGRMFYEEQLALSYKLAGYTRQYTAMLEKVLDDKDAFYKANTASAIADLETRYAFQKQETTIAQQKLAIIRKDYLLSATIIVLLFTAIVGWLVFKNFRRRQKLRLQQIQDNERRLSAEAVADAEEAERKRIAADLHDNLGAQLSFIKRNVDFILDHPSGFGRDDERRYLGYVNDIAQNAMVDLRETLWVLNKEEVSIQEFADKLKSYLRQQLLGKDFIQWEFKDLVSVNWQLTAGEVMHLFRILQEVVSNIVKHAGADHIDLLIESDQPGCFNLTIKDNGVGFEAKNAFEGHYGIENIRARAKELGAELNIRSGSGGTMITITKNRK